MIPLRNDVIEARFEIFGGEAHYCLSIDPSVVKEGAHTLRKAIDTIASAEDLVHLLSSPSRRIQLRATVTAQWVWEGGDF